ncbi:MAG: TetR/AcrR family transcriptional regulator [Firmicutes bacterium]|nr:TetR/AcrR family transcriptional regulator [Bacillota bacterium]
MAVAARLFTRQGFHKTSVEEIARAAKVGKATIYLFFRDKAGLLGEVYWRKAMELKDKMVREITPGEGTVARLLKMLGIYWDFCSSDPIFSEFLSHREEVQELEFIPEFDAIEEEAVNLIGKVLNEGIERGEIRPMPTDLAAHLLFRVGFYLSHHGRDLFKKFSPEAILDLFDSVLVCGVAKVGNS